MKTIDGESVFHIGDEQIILTLFREIVRGYVPKAVFHVFNWTFISFIQSVLLLLIAAPVYTILLASRIDPHVSNADIAYLVIELLLVLVEYISDQQQWGRPVLVPAQYEKSGLTVCNLQSTRPRRSST
jgi:hypothetical protein